MMNRSYIDTELLGIFVSSGTSNSDSSNSEANIDDFADRSRNSSNSSDSDFDNTSENSGDTEVSSGEMSDADEITNFGHNW